MSKQSEYESHWPSDYESQNPDANTPEKILRQGDNDILGCPWCGDKLQDQQQSDWIKDFVFHCPNCGEPIYL